MSDIEKTEAPPAKEDAAPTVAVSESEPPPLASPSTITETQRSSLHAIYGDNPVIPHSTDHLGEVDPHGVMGGPDDRQQNGDVIEVFEDDAPRPAAPILTQGQAGLLGLCLVIVIIFPFLFSQNARWVDFVAVLCFLPAGIAFVYAFMPRQKECAAPISLWGKFAFGWLVLLPCVFFVVIMGIVIGTFLLALFLGLLRIHSGILFGVMWTILFTVMLVAIEEFAKFLIMAKKDKFSSFDNPRQFVMYSMFSALGLATGEAFYMVLFIRRAFDAIAIADARASGRSSGGYGGGGGDMQGMTHSPGMSNSSLVFGSPDYNPDLAGADDTLWILFNCVMVIIPMHVLSGYHVGLGIARNEVMKLHMSQASILIAPFFFRFFFLYTILWVPLFTGMFWLSLTAFLMIPLYIIVVRRDELKMPRNYLKRAGYLNAFGYGVIPEDDDDDTEGQGTSSQPAADPEAAATSPA